MPRCTICCCCFGLDVVPPCSDEQFVPAALASNCCPNANMCNVFALLWPPSKWCPHSKMYDLPLLWSRNSARILRWTMCCRRFCLEVVPQKLECAICCRCFVEVVPQFQAVRFLAVALVSKWCATAKKCDLFPLLCLRSRAPMLRYTICCRCCSYEVEPQLLRCTICCCRFGLEVVPQC